VVILAVVNLKRGGKKMSEDWTDYLTMEELNFKKPESWDAKDFIFRHDLFCPICATPEDGTCQVLEE
jgi:hypothetical protein